MKRVILYGELAKRFGKEHRFEIGSVSEAIRALRVNFKGFEEYLCTAHHNGMGFKVIVGRHGIAEPSELHNPTGESEDIRIVPAILGSGGVFRAIIGAVLIATSFLVPGLGTVFAGALLNVGAALVIGGIASLLTKPPETKRPEERKNSSVFSGPVNTTQQGVAVPVGYGRMVVGSVVISAGIETSDT
jgi:predicted phage tail protein